MPPPHRSSSPVDRFNFDWTLKNPAGEPTRPRGNSNPPPVDLEEPRSDVTAKARHEDQARVFAQASPYIFQRKQGGWNAKFPELDISDHRTIAGSTQVSSGNRRGQHDLWKPPEKRGEAITYIAMKPTSTAQRKSNEQTFVFVVTDTTNPAYDAKIQGGGAHASNEQNGRAQSHRGPSGGVADGRSLSSETQHHEMFNSDWCAVREDCSELDTPRHVLWQ